MAIQLDGTTGIVASGNITGANFLTAGAISATGNITGATGVFNSVTATTGLTGNGSALTDLNASELTSGTVDAARLSGTYTITVSGAATTAGTVTTNAQPNITSVGSLTSLVVTGNVTGGNLDSAGILTINSNGADVAIVNGAANATGNIGSSTGYFNTVFAKATSAQYADLAEMYRSDYSYSSGTVVSFGGEEEVTMSRVRGDTRVAGVVSSNPSYLMNATQEGDHVIPIALVGKVPTRVRGPVKKGDMMVSTGDGMAMADNDPALGSVIGKSLEDFAGGEGVIEIVIGRV